jgi:hypothetical protein
MAYSPTVVYLSEDAATLSKNEIRALLLAIRILLKDQLQCQALLPFVILFLFIYCSSGSIEDTWVTTTDADLLPIDGPGMLRITPGREKPNDIVVTRPAVCCGMFRHTMPKKGNSSAEVIDRWMQPMSYLTMTINTWEAVMRYAEIVQVTPTVILTAMEAVFGDRSNAKVKQWEGAEWFMDQHYIR